MAVPTRCHDNAGRGAADIGRVLAQADARTPGQACTRLVDLAKAAGGRDNITVAVAPCVPD
jgi:serine/threonine protein phosphatase PrpC